jgi:hypothetical protein
VATAQIVLVSQTDMLPQLEVLTLPRSARISGAGAVGQQRLHPGLQIRAGFKFGWFSNSGG